MTILVSFNRLVPSQANVRRVNTELAPLVASLRADGILQNLVVAPRDEAERRRCPINRRGFQVVAGSGSVPSLRMAR